MSKVSKASVVKELLRILKGMLIDFNLEPFVGGGPIKCGLICKW